MANYTIPKIKRELKQNVDKRDVFGDYTIPRSGSLSVSLIMLFIFNRDGNNKVFCCGKLYKGLIFY